MCSASASDTLLANSRKDDSSSGSGAVVSNKKGEVVEEEDLKNWMHKNGLPPCKVVLKERASHHAEHRPIHYVAASEDLQVKNV